MSFSLFKNNGGDWLGVASRQGQQDEQRKVDHRQLYTDGNGRLVGASIAFRRIEMTPTIFLKRRGRTGGPASRVCEVLLRAPFKHPSLLYGMPSLHGRYFHPPVLLAPFRRIV